MASDWYWALKNGLVGLARQMSLPVAGSYLLSVLLVTA